MRSRSAAFPVRKRATWLVLEEGDNADPMPTGIYMIGNDHATTSAKEYDRCSFSHGPPL